MGSICRLPMFRASSGSASPRASSCSIAQGQGSQKNSQAAMKRWAMTDLDDILRQRLRAWSEAQTDTMAESRLIAALRDGSFRLASRSRRGLTTSLAVVVAVAAVAGAVFGVGVLHNLSARRPPLSH